MTGLTSDRSARRRPASRPRASADADLDRVVAARPVGRRRRPVGRSGRRRSRRSRGPRSCGSARRRRVPGDAATGPRSRSRSASTAGRRCQTPSIATSTLRDAAVRRPGDPGDRDAAGRDARPLRGVSIRDWVRIGAVLRPAERDPVAVERLERRELELGRATSSPTRSRTGRGRSGGPGSRGSGAAARRSSSARSSARAPGP